MGLFPSSANRSSGDEISGPKYIESWRPPPSSHLLDTFESSNVSWARLLQSEISNLDSFEDLNTRMAAQKYYSAVVTLVCKYFKLPPSDIQMRTLELLQTASCPDQLWAPRGKRSQAEEGRIQEAKDLLALIVQQIIEG